MSNPLSLAYVDILARRTVAGDREASEELTVVLGGLAEAVAGKYSSSGRYRGMERNDIRQEASAAMVAALKTWNPDKASFRTHAYAQARYAILKALNRSLVAKAPQRDSKALEQASPYIRASAKRAAQPAASLTPSSDDEPDLAEILGQSEKEFEETTLLLTIQQIYRRTNLTNEERRALEARFGVGERAGFGAPRTEKGRVQELAQELGVSEEAAYRLAEGALQKLSASHPRGKEEAYG